MTGICKLKLKVKLGTVASVLSQACGQPHFTTAEMAANNIAHIMQPFTAHTNRLLNPRCTTRHTTTSVSHMKLSLYNSPQQVSHYSFLALLRLGG